MRNILGSLFGSLFVFLFAPMLPAQAQFGDLLKKLEQEVKKGAPSQPSQGGGGEKSSQNNIQVMDGVDSNILDKVTPSFYSWLSDGICRGEFGDLARENEFDVVKVSGGVSALPCSKEGVNWYNRSDGQLRDAKGIFRSSFRDPFKAQQISPKYWNAFLLRLSVQGSVGNGLLSQEMVVLRKNHQEFLAREEASKQRLSEEKAAKEAARAANEVEEAKLNAEAKAVADKALGGDFSGVESCSQLTDNRQLFNPKWRQANFFAGGGKLDVDEQPTLEPTNSLRATIATFVRYDPPVGFLMTKTNPIKFIAPKGTGKVWFNKERTKLNSNLLVIGKYVKNEKVMMTNGQEVVVPVLEAWCIEQVD